MNPRDNTRSNQGMWKHVTEIQDSHSLSKRAASRAMDRRAAELTTKWKEHAAFNNAERRNAEGIRSKLVQTLGKDTVIEFSRRMLRMEKQFSKKKLTLPPKTVVQPRITTGSLISFF